MATRFDDGRLIRNGFGEVAIVIVKGRVTFLKVTEQEAVNEVELTERKMR